MPCFIRELPQSHNGQCLIFLFVSGGGWCKPEMKHGSCTGGRTPVRIPPTNRLCIALCQSSLLWQKPLKDKWFELRSRRRGPTCFSSRTLPLCSVMCAHVPFRETANWWCLFGSKHYPDKQEWQNERESSQIFQWERGWRRWYECSCAHYCLH